MTTSAVTRPAAASTGTRTTTTRSTPTEDGVVTTVTTTSAPDRYDSSDGSVRTPCPWATTQLPTVESQQRPDLDHHAAVDDRAVRVVGDRVPSLTPYPFTPIPGPTIAPEPVDPNTNGVQNFSAPPQPTTQAPPAP